ncbi:MAG: type I phosphomannose isomerase catalytic subunit [Pirellulaceae bacterium]
MIPPYPLRLVPLFRDYLWGGRKLQTVLGKTLPANGVWAESWEIVDHPEHSSAILNGPLADNTLHQVCEADPKWLLGDQPQEKESSGGSDNRETNPRTLPLLLKYLDCQRVLSVQVHPDDHYGQQMLPPDLGKTEAWYIIAAEPESVLYAGLKLGVTREDLQAALAAGEVEQCLHRIHPQAGDCVFIPAGTVHALGAGLLVAEIQQASNTTFRLFDWNRLDADGQPRALHVEQSLEVIDFASGPRRLQVAQPIEQLPSGQVVRERLVECDKFLLDRLRAAQEDAVTLQLGGDGRCHLVTVPVGQATLSWGDASSHSEQLATGQSILLPAALSAVSVQLEPGTTLLDMRVP